MEIATSLVTIDGSGLVLLRERWCSVVEARQASVEVYHVQRKREDLQRLL